MTARQKFTRWFLLGLAAAAFGASAAQAATRPDDRAGPLGVGTALVVRADDRAGLRGAAPGQSDVISRYLISHSAVRPDDRAGPLGVGSDSAVGIVTPAHSVILDSTGFQWSDAGIGAGTALGLILLALGATVLVRSGRVRSA
jgi:hypothetical protein